MPKMPQSVYSVKYQQFLQQLRAEREAARWTQTDLALRLGKPQSYVSKYERGAHRLDMVEFLEIADVLGIDVVRFVERLV